MEQNEILEETRRTNELLRGQLLWMRAAVHRFCAKQGRLSALWKTAGCATMKQQTGGMIP